MWYFVLYTKYIRAQPPVEDSHTWQCTPDTWTDLCDWTCKHTFTSLAGCNLNLDGSFVRDFLYFLACLYATIHKDTHNEKAGLLLFLTVMQMWYVDFYILNLHQIYPSLIIPATLNVDLQCHSWYGSVWQLPNQPHLVSPHLPVIPLPGRSL